MKEICVLTFLGINAWTDLRKKEVSLAAVGVFAVLGFAWTVYAGGISWEFLVPAGVGCLFLALSILTRGAVGMGDGWLLLALGTVLDTEEFLAVLFTGMVACAVWSGLLLAVFHKRKNMEIPFVPFLLIGYIGGVLLWR